MRQFLLGLSFSVVFIVGCAVGTMQGSQVASAQPTDGSWFCFPSSGSRSGLAEKTALGREENLNKYASHVANGESLVVDSTMICVKH